MKVLQLCMDVLCTGADTLWCKHKQVWKPTCCIALCTTYASVLGHETTLLMWTLSSGRGREEVSSHAWARYEAIMPSVKTALKDVSGPGQGRTLRRGYHCIWNTYLFINGSCALQGDGNFIVCLFIQPQFFSAPCPHYSALPFRFAHD